MDGGSGALLDGVLRCRLESRGMDSRNTPPPIPPLGANVSRPLWSVMIPTYNCTKYLPETLRSVLEQDLGPEKMQIEVVDDASDDKPEDIVQSIGAGRVEFFRQAVNGGVVSNFNTCISRSRGALVHILHGDDLVRPGFYARIAELSRQWPAAALLATRSLFIDEAGVVTYVSPRLVNLERETRAPGRFLYECLLQCAGVVIRRSFYEAFGGFDRRLVHTADWEMWLRAITLGGGVVSAEPLACYRTFEGNDSSRLRRTGENLRDYLRLADILEGRVPDFDARRFRAAVARDALDQARFFSKRGDPGAARANEDVWREVTSFKTIVRRAAGAVLDAGLDALRDVRRKVAL